MATSTNYDRLFGSNRLCQNSLCKATLRPVQQKYCSIGCRNHTVCLRNNSNPVTIKKMSESHRRTLDRYRTDNPKYYADLGLRLMRWTSDNKAIMLRALVKRNADPGSRCGWTNLWKDPAFASAQSKRSSKRMKILNADPTFRKALELRSSRRMTELWMDHTARSVMGWKFSTYISSKAGTLLCRSGWEYRAFLQLDDDPNVLWYCSEPFPIPYHFNGIWHNYYPDILVLSRDGHREVIEIKPSGFIKYPVNIEKFYAASSYCRRNAMKFTIWTDWNWPSHHDLGGGNMSANTKAS